MEGNVIVTQNPGIIKCDFEEAKKYIHSKVDEYKGIIFTEDTKTDAKKTVAALRKEKEALKDRVKEVKAEWMKPFDEFYSQACELIEMYDEPIDFINGQVADFEKKRIEEKRNQIRQMYCECIEPMCDQIPLEKIYDKKWENATANPTSIRRDLMEIKEKVKSGIEAITAMNSEVTEKALAMFLNDYDLTSAILYINNYEQIKREAIAREEERIRREEEERIRREERAKIEAEIRAEEEKKKAVEEAKAELVEEAKAEAVNQVIEALMPELEGESNLYEYRISLTKDAKEKLELYMNSVGIEWEEIR